ncbi:MAG: hybrid sensor histidine kinase/response regulator [Pelatocladus maniniholoensis HA4357-MV3]|uniref:histidine kinase n=1 Tax=Pelatocladus maniniholoensis HA4357-MV3 TaxID=1117104 RepID=A0A9E3H929_9NOST|nr:hybrid sensor histidine kinase/response regulator [Pelatocladus maniniholoensis HA4357-MV3]BAZ70518.1 response regulator receiver domain protein [Fischerella sp. NIES-4106]
MSLDPTIREQTYPYFLQEAPELLQALEQGLLNLRENCGINQVNDLMRATHTLKGAATSVGLETIATVAHSLEDIFKALCQPNVVIDPEVEALLFEGFECLRLPLVAELTGGSVNQAEILDRTAAIFARLQEKLGDFFAQEAYLPTSAELGFDLTQSLFEVGVTQRLEQIATILDNGQPEEIARLLRTQAEVFLGLAESLNLSGFGAIAQAVLSALNHQPHQAVVIAELALRDLQVGQAAVLAGDRVQGGEPSIELQQLAIQTTESETLFLTSVSETDDDQEIPSIESIWGQQTSPIEPIIHQHLEAFTQLEQDANWEQDFSSVYNSPEPKQSISPVNPLPPKDQVSPSPIVRVSVKHLDELNYSIGELVTNQNHQSLQIEELQASNKTLLNQIKQHQKLLIQLQDQYKHQISLLERSQTIGKSSSKKARKASKAMRSSGVVPTQKHNDSAYLIQSLLDHTVQLAETAEAIDLLNRSSQQTSQKQQQLLNITKGALIEARMLTLGEIFGRFPQILQQLKTLYNKPISLQLYGNEVLVDKAVAEKLFDPLLHLVRNAFDHGIEPVTVRQQRGKPEKGEIKISAYHQNKYLVIEVQDDGNGLDFDQIRQRAVERELISVEQANNLNQTQLTNLLFEPGFSTASQVNDLSGRGVGLDVVRNQLKSLQGEITVNSELHQGTKFILQIPLSLTIAQLFICGVGCKTYAFVDEAVEQILIPTPSQIQERNGNKFLRWGKEMDEKLVSIYSLASILDYNSPTFPLSYPPTPPPPLPILLIRCQEQLLGLEVEQLIGEQELVIRPLGAMIAAPNYVHGASILADGELALVIDGGTLLQKVLAKQHNDQISRIWAKSITSLLPPSSQQPLLSDSHTVISALSASESDTKASARILIVDDSLTTRQSVAIALQKAGYCVFQAQDGHKGIEQFQHLSDIQLVICDIEMPRMNGFEFLRSRQQIPALADIPVLILSSQSSEKHHFLALQLGATAYMTKPYMEQKLLAMVANLLERDNT